MLDPKILIAGYGNIGKLEYLVYTKKYKNTFVYDKFKAEYNSENIKKQHYDFCIICVDTPLDPKTGLCSTEAVEDVVKTIDADIFICRSTIPVGSTDRICKQYGVKMVMCPEFYGTTPHANNFTFEFTILGGEKKACCKCQQMYQGLFDARHIFRIVDAKTAEICKFMENSFLAMKVSFCQSFWKICQETGANYEDLRECIVLDPRIGFAHTFVYDDQPYWSSHCLNKDVPSIANQFDNKLMKSVIEFNEQMKKYSDKKKK